MSSDSDVLLKTMARPEVQTGLVLFGIERKDVPALCLEALSSRARLNNSWGSLNVAACKTLSWLSQQLPAVGLRRAGWRANAWHSAIGFASSLELAVQINEERQRREKIIRQLAVDALAKLSPAFQAMFSATENPLVQFLPLDVSSASQINVLSEAARQAVVLCIASSDWAEDDIPPSLAVMNMEDAYSRARLHYSLRANSEPAASMQDSSAHGAEGEQGR